MKQSVYCIKLFLLVLRNENGVYLKHVPCHAVRVTDNISNIGFTRPCVSVSARRTLLQIRSSMRNSACVNTRNHATGADIRAMLQPTPVICNIITIYIFYTHTSSCTHAIPVINVVEIHNYNYTTTSAHDIGYQDVSNNQVSTYIQEYKTLLRRRNIINMTIT